MPDDPFAAFGGHAVDQTPTTSDDPFAAFGGRSVSAPTAPQNPQPQSDPFAQFGGQSTSPLTGQESSAPKFDYQDPNKSWYSRAWSWANTPLTESLFGLPENREGAGGFERGLEHIAGGLTSPLSLALTAATFGTGGFIESLGANTLKEAGLSAAEIANIVKGSEVALNAAKDLKPIEPAINEALVNGGHDLSLLQRAKEATGPLNLETEFGEPAVQKTLEKAGFSPEEISALSKTSDTITKAKADFKPIEDAVRQTGVDPDLLKRGQDILRDNGLNEQDLLGGNLLQRGAFQLLRKTVPELPIAVASRAAKTAETIMNAGFTYQQLETAAAMSPQFLDALKEGDTDKAWEYGTEAFAGGALGILGASHALHSAGELFHPLLESDAPRPSDEWQSIQRANSEREAQHAVAEQEAINVSNKAKELLGHEAARPVIGDSSEVKSKKLQDLSTTELGVHTGMDADKAAAWHDVLAEAAGREDRIRPVNGLADDWMALERKVSTLTGKPSEDVSIDDIAKAGGSEELQNQWSEYFKRPFAASLFPEELKEHSRFTSVPFTDKEAPSLVLNDFAHELISRTPSMSDRSWKASYLTKDQVAEVAKELRNSDPNSKLADALEKTLSNSNGLVLSKNSVDVDSSFDHEQIHHWQDQYPISPEQISSLEKLPEYQKVARELFSRGYNNSSTWHDEVGSHLLSDDNLNLSKKEAQSLSDAYLKLFPKEAIENLPVRTKNALQSIKELGYDDQINRRAAQRILEQKARVSRSPEEALALPENLREQIAGNNFKNQAASYQTLVLNSLRAIAEDKVPDNVKSTITYLRNQQDRNFEIGSANDLLHSYLEDYMTRVYKDQNPEGKVILSNAKAGKFATRVTMARQRVYDSTLTALLKSPKELSLDPVDSTAQGRAQLIKAAANKQLIDNLRDKFTRASDGRPAVVLSGSGQVVSGPNGEDPKTFIDPNRVRKINISDGVVEQLQKNGNLQRFLDDGTIKDITPYVRPNNIGAAIDRLEDQAGRREAQYDAVGNNKLRTDIMYLKSMQNNNDFSGLKEFNDSQPKVYAWDPQDYISLDHSAMKGWNFITNDPSGNGIFVRSDIKVHPEFADYLKNRLGLEQGALSKNPIGKAILGTGTKLKETLLSLSPFHAVQIMLRGIMTGINPFTLNGPDIIEGAKIDPLDPNSPTKLRKMVEQGYTTGTDYKGQQAYSEGVASGDANLIRKIPVVGPLVANSQQFFTDFLFKRFLPAIKATAAEKMFDDYRAKYPEWSVDKVAKAAALHANDSFGGVNWKAMGRSATSQEFARALLLAPDWLESELRSGARLFNKDEGAIGRGQVLKMAGAMWLMARVLNTVTTGNAHYEAPFSLATKSKDGKETLWSIRTLPTDLMKAAVDPVGFVKGRLSPTVHLGQELLSGRDNYGRKLSPEDLWSDAMRQMLPIPVQSVGQAISGTGPEVGNVGQAWKAIGGTATNYQTPAGKMAADLAASHSEDGLVDPAQQQRHRMVMDLEDKTRTGDVSWPDLMKMTYQTDQLKESELRKIQQNLQKTKGMDSTLASLFTRASRLPAKEYLQLYTTMNATERAALVPLTLQVQKRYLTKAKKEMTPQEREQDPTFQTLLRLTPRPPAEQ